MSHRIQIIGVLVISSMLLTAAAPRKKSKGGQVTSMTFSTSGTLLVGWSDGKLGTIDIKKKRGALKTLDRGKSAVVAIAPNGKSAVLASEPVAVVETQKGLHLAEVSKISHLEGAAFTRDGEYLLISGKDRLLVWKDAHSLDELGKKGIKLEVFVARQSGDYSAMLGDMEATIAVMDEGPRVLFANPEGLLTLWDMRNRTEASYIAKIPPPHAIRTLHNDLALIASAKDRELHVFHYEGGKKTSWNKTLKADDAIGTPQGVAVVDEGKLSLRHTDTGAALWSVTLDDTKDPCGMTYGYEDPKKPSKPRLAVCQDDHITVHDLDTGEVLSQYERSGSKLSSKKLPKKSK